MAKEGGVPKYDPNQEIVQMRAQELKAENCRKQWHKRWHWLLQEREQALSEARSIRAGAADVSHLHRHVKETEFSKSLKPVPVTSTGFVGWLANKPDCQLEVYKSGLLKIPLKAPDVWDKKDYYKDK